MKNILVLLTLSITSCAPKEQISIFDSNMLIRTTEENEKITEEITSINKQCENDHNQISKALEVQRAK